MAMRYPGRDALGSRFGCVGPSRFAEVVAWAFAKFSLFLSISVVRDHNWVKALSILI